MTFGEIAIGIGLVVGAGASAYATTSQAGIAGQELSLANTQSGRQQIAFNQLQTLINNPGSFFDNPVFQSSLSQGTQAVQRAEAAQGISSPIGGQAQALQAYGQGFASQQLLGQEQLLAGMTGTGFNPAGSLQAASGASSAATGSLSNLAGLIGFFGSSGAAGQMFGGSGINAGNMFSNGVTSNQFTAADLNSFSSGMGNPFATG
jgi:hypothetical protein